MSSWNMRAASDTAHGRRRMIGEQLDTAPDAGPPPPGALPALRSDATPGRGNGRLDQAGSRGWSATSGARTRKPLQSYCARELNRWHERLVRKGRHLKTAGASRRHRLRIKAKRFRYMLEALTETVALWGRRRIPSPAPAGKTAAARIGRHARSRALRRPCRRIAAGRKWQTRQEASAGLSPSKGKAARRRHRGSSRPQGRPALLTPPSALPLDIVRV